MVNYAQNIHNIAVTAYSSFAAEGWYQLGVDRQKVKSLFELDVIINIAKSHQKSKFTRSSFELLTPIVNIFTAPAQIVLAWAINRGLAIIPKTSDPKRLVENLSVTDIKLSAEDMKQISSLNINLRYSFSFFALCSLRWIPNLHPLA